MIDTEAAMTVQEFQEQLRQTGAYESPAEAVGDRIGWLFGRGTAGYYLRALGIVLAARRLVRQNRYTREAWAASSFDTVRTVETCGGAVSIAGLLPRGRHRGPVVYVANHMSMLETFLLPCVLLTYGDIATVVKESLTQQRLFGPIMRSVRPICVGRQNPRDDLRAVLDQGAAALAQDRSILIFPQATRTPSFDAQAFNSLGAKLARRAGAPMLAVALKTDFQGLGKVFRDYGRIDRRKRVYLRFGEPLTVSGNGREEHERVVAFIGHHLRAWGVPVINAPTAEP